MTEKKKYIVKSTVKQATIFNVEAWNPAHAREVAATAEPSEVSPEEKIVRVKLDAPPKEKKTEVIGEEGESTPEPTKKGKRK